MLGLAVYALKSVPQAGLLAAVFLTLSLLFPPFVWLSSAVVVVVTLHKGWRHGAFVVVFSVCGSALFFYLSLGGWRAALDLALVFWLPVYVMALALRVTVRLEISLLLAGAMGLLALTGIYVVQEDPSAVWLATLRQMMQVEIWAEQFQIPPEEFNNFLIKISWLMPGSTVACLVFSAILGLLLGRRWQARLFNPNGFQSEYHQLRYGRGAAIITLGAVVAGVVIQSSYAFGLAVITMVVYLFQGIAVVHAVVKLRLLNVSWLVGMYVLTIVLPQMILILAGIGWFDTWWDSRKRLAPGGSAD